jgi:hypothetical protein
MNKKTIPLNWNTISNLISGVGLILAASGLFYTAKQIELSRKIAKSEFMREFYTSIQIYNDIQIKLAKNGEWRLTENSGPSTEEEWFRLQRYMGLIEQIDVWYKDNIMSIDHIDNAYSHRIKAIYSHPVIKEKLLLEEGYRWVQFLHLVENLKAQPVYKMIEFNDLPQK